MNKLLQYLTNKPDVNHRALPGLEKFMRGGQPCYECGGSVNKYAVGGFYDCPDQEKDPETGKCKAEVVRGREAAAANKAANADMNAWAKQVAAMDKEVAKQNAAQAAGQLTFDYDWMQSPVDKADKKAAMAASKQFFQQNPNVFVADDTSGYSPEQKYIIASKLKQRLSTPMGAQLAQKKLGVDPRYYDLQRMQSELAPKMGGWEGMRNFLFNVHKQKGGEYNLPQAQWGSLVNPSSMATMATIAAKAKEFFGFNEPKIVRTPASAPKRLSIRDPRKVMMTTGKPLRPNSDLVTGQYNSEHLGNLLTEAKRRNMSYNDMMNLAAMGFQETKWGRSDDNIGHTKGEFGDEPMQDSYSNFIDAYNAKMKDADRLKIKDEATRLQVYNGLGKIFPSTEADYHGFKMQKIYGVPVPKGGIDLRKNPLYGKQVIDIRDNVLKRNPEFMRYMDSTYRAPMPKQQFANGGLTKMQIAGQNNTPQRVSINDPRYAELYKNRQVGSYYDGAYSLPDLPEVTVTGKDERIKEGMSQGSAKFLQGALGVMGSPQTGLMEVITGKQQTPSQAWGFNTKGKSWYHPKSISNFAMDTVLDPMNALGVGVADDVIRTTLKGVGKRTVPNIRPVGNIRSSIDDIRRGSDLRGTGFEEDPFYHKQLFEDRKKSVIERLNTDKGRQRLQDFIDDNYKKNPKNFGTENQNLLQWFKSGFKDYTKITPDKVVDDLKKMEFVPSSYAGFDKDNAFLWFHKGINKPSVMNIGEAITPYDALHTFEHELGHFFQRNRPSTVDNILSKLKLKETEDPIKLNVFRSEAPLIETGYSTTKLSPHYTTLESPKNYFTSGSGGQEKMPFAAELRENLLQRGIIKDYYDDITPDLLRKHKDIYDKTGGAKRIQRLYQIMEDSPENLDILSQALNKMPQVVLPTAAGALAVKSSLDEKKKQGGPILDPRGQWAHPGKVTRIPGSDITMQGVPYPVYGVGSNGQEQMMYPEQEYDFGGASYVDEYPMMQTGGSTKGSSSFMRTVKKYENELMNQYIDPVKARALQRAKKAGINSGIHNGPIDAIRHASSAAAMSSVIPSWANFIPGVAAANVGLTNLAGVAHEFMSPNSMKEHGSDLYNNFVGSVIGVLPVSEETKHDLILKAQKNGILSNLRNNMPVLQKSTLSLPVSQKSVSLKKNGGQHGGLDRWFAEKWVDVKTGKACGRQEGEKRAGYPACRPSRRVSSETPKTSSEMSPAEKAKFKASKTSSQRINYNHKRNK